MSGYVHYAALAERLILAQLNDDEHATDIIADEINDCPHCWRFVAEHLAETVGAGRESDLGFNAAIADTESNIAFNLDWLARWAEPGGGR